MRSTYGGKEGKDSTQERAHEGVGSEGGRSEHEIRVDDLHCALVQALCLCEGSEAQRLT